MTTRNRDAMATSSESGHGRFTTGEVVRFVVAAAIVVVLVAFCIANTDDTKVDYLVGDNTFPLVVVMVLSAVAGALIAALLRRRRHHH
jgi:uncharacterized integral membrane protein